MEGELSTEVKLENEDDEPMQPTSLKLPIVAGFVVVGAAEDTVATLNGTVEEVLRETELPIPGALTDEAGVTELNAVLAKVGMVKDEVVELLATNWYTSMEFTLQKALVNAVGLLATKSVQVEACWLQVASLLQIVPP